MRADTAIRARAGGRNLRRQLLAAGAAVRTAGRTPREIGFAEVAALVAHKRRRAADGVERIALRFVRLELTALVQHHGVHTIVSDREVAIIAYGFDRFVSYAYVGGLYFDVLQ